MTALLLLLTLLYMVALLLISRGLSRLQPPAASATRPFISVIIAARNEADHVSPLLEALARQDYPREQHEIIIVDDASSDGTAETIEQWLRANPHCPIRLLHSEGRDQVISTKKHALAQGINAARGEILLFTDADCQPPTTWISSLCARFGDQVGMVIGYSPYEIPAPHTLGQRFLALESLSLAALAAGTTGWGRPATCTGRNLGYRKSVWLQVNGFEPIARFVSGDDDLFLKQVLDRTSWRIAYALDPGAIVPTRLLPSGKAFFRQRLRHASKGFYYGWKMSSILALAWLFNLLLLVRAISSLCGPAITPWAWVAWAGKAAAELLLLIRFAGPMQRMHTLTVFPQAEAAHVLYVVLFGALGPLTRVRWKETTAHTHTLKR
ncbi:MAG TPA: glycosyltransferase [bacterium]|nr:glycosyltransferase [bacterium]HOY43589.1 glycosyltransferase [bacterium]HPM59456.1 glycosyltransferase [bacterium]